MLSELRHTVERLIFVPEISYGMLLGFFHLFLVQKSCRLLGPHAVRVF